jgi:PAS domain S-box-containing protein
MASSAPWSVDEVQSFINEYFLAWEGTDLDLIMSYYADDVVLQIPGMLMEGNDAVREQFARPFITAFPGNRHVVKNMIFGPGMVVVEWSFEAHHTGPFEGHAATGAQVKLPGSGVYEYDSVKRQVTAARIYFDVGTLLQNITDLEAHNLKTAEEAIEANQRNLSLIINSMPTFAWSARPDGHMDFINKRWIDYTGLSTDQTRDWGWTASIHPDDTSRLADYWRSIVSSGEPGEIEARLRRFDGAYRWFLFRANPLRDESGKIVRWYGANTDIEDRKRAEELLRARELSWRQIVDNIPGLVATMSPLGDVEFLNKPTLEYFGKTNEELKDWSLIGAVHPDDLPAVIEARKTSLELGQIYEVEHRCRRADGVYRWFQVRGIPVRDAEGNITAWYLLLTDIDDRKKAEEALKLSERNLKLTIDAIPTFIHTLRPDGSVLYVNQSVLDYHGCTMEDVQREDYRPRFFHPDDLDRVDQNRNYALARAVPFENEQRALGKDGTYRWFLIRYSPLLDEEGKVNRWYVAAFDIEDRKRAQDAQARQAGVRADVSAAFSKPTSLGEILHGCTEAIVRHLDAAFARIWLLSKDESVLELQASSGIYTRLNGSYSRIPVGDFKVGWIAREKIAHLTNDVVNDPRVKDRRWARLNGLVAFAGHPLVVEDRLIGVVALFARRPLSESIIGTLASVADTIAQGIERRRAEEALRNALDEIQKSEANLRQVIDTIPALAWCNLPDGPNEFLSKSWHEYTGLSEEESHGWGWQSAFHPDDLPALMEKWVKMLSSGESDQIEARLRRHDGAYKWFLIRAEPFRDESGKIVRWYGTSTDIDERKQAEDALLSNERNLNLIINTMPTLAWAALPDGSVEFMNQRWLEYTGLAQEQAAGWGWTEAIYPDDLKNLASYWQTIRQSGEPGEIEARFRRFDGEYRWFLFRAKPLRDESGNILRWYGTNTDIDDRKRAEAEVERAYILLAEAQRISQTGSFSWRVETDEIKWSEEVYRIFQFEQGTPVTLERIGSRVHPEDQAKLTHMIDDARNAVDFEYEHRLLMPDASVKYLHLIAHGMRDNEGRLEYIGAVQDVTESKIAEEALNRARSELAHMARVTTLSALTASIAHEINQPIAAVTTSAGACLRWLDRDQPEVQRAREAAIRIEEDGRRAAEIISHLRAFYRKDVSPTREMVSINDIVREMLVLLRSEADRHSVAMSTNLASELPSVNGDRVQLRQVLMNLMLNGMEAMSEKGGELKIGTRHDSGNVTVSVSDTGEGIPADMLDQIFNAFVTTKSGGTGMGLSISSTIIESHGGRLWAAVNSGPGATFHFTLPTEIEA